MGENGLLPIGEHARLPPVATARLHKRSMPVADWNRRNPSATPTAAVLSTVSVLVRFAQFAGFGRRDHAPGVPRDLEDDEGDEQSDDRVGDLGAEGDDAGARDDAERDKPVDAGVVAVSDEGGAREASARAQPDLGCDLVADEADQTGEREH